MIKMRIIGLLFLTVVFVGIRLNYSSFSVQCTQVVSSCFMYPLLRVQHYCANTIHLFFKKRHTIEQLELQCTCLEDENNALNNENCSLKALLSHAEVIHDLIAFKKRYQKTSEKIVHILARHLSAEQQFFLVNAGSRDGVYKDMVVLYGNALIGKVTDVYPWYCKVILITDAQCSVAARCTKTGAVGIHVGTNHTEQGELCFVSHLDTVVESDLVISSGEGLIFPEGFALGIVSACAQGELVYTISIKPIVDMRTINYCTICSKADLER
jgi:rod shape-determining protein MreC